MNIRQTPMFAKYLQHLGWLIENIDGVNFFIRRLPLLTPIIKLQRPDKLPKLDKIYQLMQKYGAKRVDVEPLKSSHKSRPNIKPMLHPYNQTQTILIDLAPPIPEIFHRFASAKRRAVRRAQKNNVQIEISQNIDTFIKLKNKSAGWVLPWLTKWTVVPLWKEFAPKNMTVILACTKENQKKVYLGGILLLHADNCAYYWMAGYTKKAKNLAAPTLLVWESLKYAKKLGCATFDFEGIYDERLPHQGRDWQGFSKFKSGFGGQKYKYPLPYHIYLPGNK